MPDTDALKSAEDAVRDGRNWHYVSPPGTFGGFMYEDFANEYIRLKGWGAPSPYCMVWGVSGW